MTRQSGTLIVLSNPVPGREDEYNDWYTNRHLDDVLAVPGIVAATRLKLCGEPEAGSGWRYCAIYDVEGVDPAAVLGELNNRAGTATMPLSEALDLSGLYAAVYEPFASKRQSAPRVSGTTPSAGQASFGE